MSKLSLSLVLAYLTVLTILRSEGQVDASPVPGKPKPVPEGKQKSTMELNLKKKDGPGGHDGQGGYGHNKLQPPKHSMEEENYGYPRQEPPKRPSAQTHKVGSNNVVKVKTMEKNTTEELLSNSTMNDSNISIDIREKRADDIKSKTGATGFAPVPSTDVKGKGVIRINISDKVTNEERKANSSINNQEMELDLRAKREALPVQIDPAAQSEAIPVS